MSLATYKKKRSFTKTPEPKGKKASAGKSLHFVVQQHDAQQLHYDFRLEMDGVLKSWAIPKGPSMNPGDKRLAVMVEDHPYDYKDFEGIIPKGNYGAGTVIVWDEGIYEPLETSKNGRQPSAQKILLEQLKKGSLKIKLQGEKLKGDFALVQTKTQGDKNWLLIKKKDRFAKTTDITKKNKSVKSGMKLEQVAKQPADTWTSNSINKKPTRKKTPTSKPVKKKEKEIPAEIEGHHKTAIPKRIKPMLATLTDEPFNDAHWLFEIKWDGYRAIAYRQKSKVEILSRKNISFNKKFAPVAEALQQLEVEAVFDGEIVALDNKGKSEFQQLQQWQKTGQGKLVYYIFDLLWLNGYDTKELPLVQRKELLQQCFTPNEVIRFSDHVEDKGKDFFDAAVKAGLEGIMAKHKESVYTPGLRTGQWLKVKTHYRQEAVIAGFTQARGGRKHFGALVVGIYEGNELMYAGHSGSGFNEKELVRLYKRLKPLIRKTSPFRKTPKTNMPCTWVKPELVCEIKFAEWTDDNMMRQPVYMGLREDKNPKEVHREKAVEVKKLTNEEQLIKEEKMPAKKTTKKKAAKKSAAKKTVSPEQLLSDEEKKRVLTVNKQELTFTNLDKIYFPKEKITKRAVLNYYHAIANYILPYLKNRPQSLNRHPNGITKPGFYQKDVSGKVAGWLEKYDYVSESDGEKKEYLVCTNEASLLYMANLGCIEMNPWHSTVKKPGNPDWCVIDLDPAKISFDKVIETAQVVHEVCDSMGIANYCKTSGSTGLHIYIPLGAKYDYDQSRQLAELIVTLVHKEIPSFTSLERSPSKRKTKIYLDYLQNRSIQTIAAPYSLRPKPGATVSAPLHWEEVKKGLSIQDFTINNILDRVNDIGDIFKPVLGKGINLKKALDKIAVSH